MKKTILLSVFAFIILLSCAKSETEMVADMALKASTNDLVGSWKFLTYSDNKKHEYEVSLEFKNEKSPEGKPILSGRSSVNFYTATFEVNPETKVLQIGAIGRTKIAGTPEANNFEMIYLERLGKATTYDFRDSKTLRIYVSEPAKEVLFFEKI